MLTNHNKEYIRILTELFRTPKVPKNNALAVFDARKLLFNSIYASSKIPSTVKVIQVAGTKGKGSTVEFISSALRSHSSSVGIFTSPHIHTARERFRIGKEIISKEDFIRLGKRSIDLGNAVEDNDWILFFDYLVCMAIQYFGEHKVEHIVWETGIGGRYDSTNFLASCDVCVITRIGYDHQALLGNTIEEIAWQKAGIIKPNSHVFTPATQAESVLSVIRQECTEKGAYLHEVPIGLSFLPTGLLSIDVSYPVQVENACLSAAVLEHLKIPLSGMNQFFWPCRMENFRISSSTTTMPIVDCVIDGSHNGESVELFLSSLTQIDRYKNAKICIVFGAGAEKCVTDMLQVIGSERYENMPILFVQSKHFRSMSEKELESKLLLLEVVSGNSSSSSSSSSSGHIKIKNRLLASSSSLDNNDLWGNNGGSGSLDRCEEGTVGLRMQVILRESRYVWWCDCYVF